MRFTIRMHDGRHDTLIADYINVVDGALVAYRVGRDGMGPATAVVYAVTAGHWSTVERIEPPPEPRL